LHELIRLKQNDEEGDDADIPSPRPGLYDDVREYIRRNPYYSYGECRDAITAGMLGLPCITWAQRQLLPGHNCTQAQLEEYRARVIKDYRTRTELLAYELQATYERLFGQMTPRMVIRQTTPALTHTQQFAQDIIPAGRRAAPEDSPSKP